MKKLFIQNLFWILFALFIFGTICFATFSQDEIALKIEKSKEFQNDLKNASQELRNELSPKIVQRDELQRRIDKINKQLEINSKQYNLENTRQEALSEVNKSFQ
jgi:DNA topoisomerase VI subunit B